MSNPQSAMKHPSDWPTYRHDAARSGAADCAVVGALAERWSAHIGGRLTAPVVSGGRVFVVGVDDHTVYALLHQSWRDPKYFHYTFLRNFPGMRLYTANGMLDSSWHVRFYWAYGQVVGQQQFPV